MYNLRIEGLVTVGMAKMSVPNTCIGNKYFTACNSRSPGITYHVSGVEGRRILLCTDMLMRKILAMCLPQI